MNFSALATALKNIEDLSRFLTALDTKSQAVKSILDIGPLNSNVAYYWALEVYHFKPMRTYDYVCAIVLLYGILERFIEEVAEEYINLIVPKFNSYGDLPEKLRTSYFDSSVLHLQRTKDSRYDGRASAQEITSSLSSCLSGQKPYNIISESLIHHTANFRVSVIDEFFGRLGVPTISRSATGTPSFSFYLIEKGVALASERPEAVLDLINDLVVRRNEVAHGDVNNYISPDGLEPYCDQVSAYCRAICEVLVNSFFLCIYKSHGVSLGNPIKVLNNNIVCINSSGVAIEIGSKIAIEKSDKTVKMTTVVGLEINNKTVSSTSAGKAEDVGIEISDRCHKNCTLFSLP